MVRGRRNKTYTWCVVVVLGSTGRNFAAGMSGGMAFVYDVEKSFEKYCNKELVELEALDAEDKERIKGMISRHQQHTGSTVAARILENWEESLQHFVKVMPTEYKDVLKRRKEQQELSENEDIKAKAASKV